MDKPAANPAKSVSSTAAGRGLWRLPEGGLIDRSSELTFTFDAQAFTGHSGDTLASALLANGKRLMGRSFKYHRPRGVMTAGSEEPNALVELRSGARREPNTKATTVELYDGLDATSQNRWPSLALDLLAVNSWLAPLLPAGFYYKTFMWPPAFWEKVYEPLIRRAAGLGRAADAADPDHYEHSNAFCDILVIGSGPAGLAAARTAARSSVRVILCEEDFLLGGRLLSDHQKIDDVPGSIWAKRIVDELKSFSNVRLMPRTTVFGSFDSGTYGALERVADHVLVPTRHQPRQRLWRIVAKRTILAAGALERMVVFNGNDRPGIMLASAMRTYANRFAVAAGRHVLVFTNNNEGWRAAGDLAARGIDITAIVDVRAVMPEVVTAPPRTRVVLGGVIEATKGGQAVRAVSVRSPRGVETFACDAVAVSGGWNPTLALASHHDHRPQWCDNIAAMVPGGLPRGMTPAGAAAGAMTLARCLSEGINAAERAASDLGVRVPMEVAPRADDESFAVQPMWHVSGAPTKAFVDFQNDVTAADVLLAAREGFRSVEHLKRYTTLGMATDQGRTSNINGLAVMAAITGRTIGDTGTTAYRPPFNPVAIGAFAGRHRGKSFRPVRRTPTHDWAERRGAFFMEAGLWLRSQYFPRPGESDWLDATSREVATVRAAVGFCDVSTLGKIELFGADVGAFLDRVYINTFSTLPVGRSRYGLMLREDGFALDDGTVSRFADDHYFVTTTTANAGRVFQHLQFCHQVLWPELDVTLLSATEQWAQFSIAGPRARDTLAKLVDAPFDIANEAFPFMAVAEVTVCSDVPARLYRISFSGELAYEIGVPSDYGASLAEALMRAGEPYGIAPYGTEALGVMRIEKGHIAGNELDGRTTAQDLGFGRMMSKKKDFIGRSLAERPALLDPERPVIVGLRPVNRAERLRAGAHFLPARDALTAANVQGVMTSVAYSPSLSHWIGLGLLSRGRERWGERVWAADPVRDNIVEVEVGDPVFIDPKGERLRG